MKFHRTGRAGFILLSCLLLCLTACSSREPYELRVSDADDLSGSIYIPEFFDAELDAAYVTTGCIVDENVYLIGAVDQTDTAPDPDAGETGFIYRNGCALFHAPIKNRAYDRWEGYHPLDFLNGSAGNVSSDSIYPGKDGCLWISTYVSLFDCAQTKVLQKFDPSGRELVKIDLGTLSADIKVPDIISTVADKEDNLFICMIDRIFVFDSEQNHLFTLKTRSNVDWTENLILLEDGRAGLRSSQGISSGEDADHTLQTIDVTGKGWGASYLLPAGSSKVYSGSGEYLFFCDSKDSLYGYNSKTENFERLLSWTGVSINSEAVICLSALDGERLAAVVHDNGKTETAIMTKTDPSSLPEKTVLTYATLQLSGDVRDDIIEFNKSHPNCKIEVQDYSEYSNRSHGLLKLSTELAAGKIDILDTESLPVRQYGSNGVLEDLLPYLEKDPELGRDSVMSRVLEAATQDGKLYQAFDSFSIMSAAGDPNVVGDRLSWTLEDLIAAFENMPEGSTVFGDEDTKETILEKLLPMELDGFVDWDAGRCNFDSDEFKALLEFCNAIPPVYEKEEYRFDRAAEGRQLLLCAEFGRLDWEYFLYPAAFGGTCSFIGYPCSNGAVGSCFKLSGGVAITASCKDKDMAWAFVRKQFLPKYSADTVSIPVFPINSADFDRAIEIATTPIYEYDENGNIRLDEAGQPIELQSELILPDSRLEIPGRAITKAEYDQFMELYNSIDAIYSYDENIYAIVREEAVAFFSGDKSIEDVIRLIQSRATLYINENQ